jgi:WD40 repeat protein/nucleoside phosphorylase
MKHLSPYFAQKTLETLSLPEPIKKNVPILLSLSGDDYRINVARILETLFPVSTISSANSSLNRLLNTINRAAQSQGIAFEAKITADKKAGAANRWVWFEGPPPPPNPAHTSELNSIPPDQLITDQQGYFLTSDLPIIVLITFNEHETAAVLQQFHPQGEPDKHPITGATCNRLGVHGGMEIIHCVSKQGEDEAQNMCHTVIQGLRPKAVIGVGIAFGVKPDKQKIGDVLIPIDIQGYDLARVSTDHIEPRGSRPPSSSLLFQRFNHTDQSCGPYQDACPSWPTIHTGTILSGSKLVDNIDYRTSLQQLASNIIGGEMEAIGIQVAADSNKVDWIIIKAICDWADGNKNNPHKEMDQKIAAQNAALVVHKALSQGNLYPDAGLTSPTPPPEAAAYRCRSMVPDSIRMRLLERDSIPDEQLIDDAKGYAISLKKDAEKGAQESREGLDVMPTLLQWVHQPEPPHFFALLGEYGMGKTITCQGLADELLKQRQNTPNLPLPLYFDLRNITGLDRRVPSLAEALEECMERGWINQDGSSQYTLESLYELIEKQAAVIIFDGLDEVLVKLREADGQVFTNTLLKLQVNVEARHAHKNLKTPPLKILISCRTQFFRTLRDQHNHFTGQERGEHQAEAFAALVLLPLNEEQVIRYLRGALPHTDPHQLFAVIRSVHNLEELSQRPYTLRLVAQFLPEIEQDRLRGAAVYGVTLYRRMAQRWLERDAGKHHIRPEHKMRLAAHLAAHLWKNGSGLLPAEKIESWFHTWMESEPDLRRRYATLHPDQLEEDLRTATFLSRQDGEGGSVFRFAHTSLLEFFLADYLLLAVQNNAPERWDMARPSDETLDFLGQMLAEAKDPALVRTLQRWGNTYQPRISELFLSYSLLANKKNWPMPILRGMDMAGADLHDWVFAGTAEQPLDLSGADFSRTNLRRVVFEQARLDRCCFRGAQLTQANLLHCQALGADWQESDCTAAIWRACSLANGQWRQAQGKGPQFLLCKDIPAADSGAVFHRMRVAPSPQPNFIDSSQLRLVTGHNGWIRSCAWSPDSSRLLSTGEDRSLRVWDAVTGEQLLNLQGHTGRVNSCAWSPDSTRLLSAGSDQSLRVWDAATGEQLLNIQGHTGGVLSCAWSPDSTRLLSAGEDQSLRVWNAATGEQLLNIQGHYGRVRSCAWSPDSTRLLSAGDDQSLKVWDAATGEQLLCLLGHSGEVYSCDWSPDDTRLLSAGIDQSLRVWDAATGKQLLNIRSQTASLLSCAWSPDGTRIRSFLSGTAPRICVWDAATGEQLLNIKIPTAWVLSCAWSPDSTLLLSAGNDRNLRVWDANTGEQLLYIQGHTGAVCSCAWSPDSTRLLSAGSDRSLRVWDTATGEQLFNIQGHTSRVYSCDWSPDSTRLLSAGDDRSLRVWDAATGEQILNIQGHTGGVCSCAWSPDSTRLLSAGDDHILRVWGAATGKQILNLQGHYGTIFSCAWSPDSTRLLSAGSDRSLRVWDAATGEQILNIQGHYDAIFSCAWSPDSTRLLSADSDRSLRVWDATTGEQILNIQGHYGAIFSCAWSPDSTRLLSAGDDQSLRVWDAAAGEQLLYLQSHSGRIRSCAWSPDSTRLLSAGEDGSLRAWDATTGQLLRIHVPMKNGHVVWEPDSNRILEAKGDIWRYLAWAVTDADGKTDLLPLEAFGPLLSQD